MENSQERPPCRSLIRLLAWGGIIGPTLFVAAFTIAGALRAAPAWRAWGVYSIATGVVALVTLLLTFITSQRSLAASVRIGGLLERLLVVQILVWFVAFGVKLARLEAPPSPSPMALRPTEQGGVR
jgi:hypothetical protein